VAPEGHPYKELHAVSVGVALRGHPFADFARLILPVGIIRITVHPALTRFG
jgi:hypothetical protein